MPSPKHRRSPSAQVSQPGSLPGMARSHSPVLDGIPLLFAALALIGGAAWVVYGRAVNLPFIFDDRISITENSSIVALWPLVGDSEHPGPLNPPKDLPTSGRPLVNLSLALNYYFGQLDPLGYHVFNLIVHVLSALLLLAIVRRTLRLDYFGGRFDRASGPLALAVALLWVVHPLQTETVVYVTQRTELLVGFFYLATLYSSLRYWAAVSPAGRNTWLILSTIACLAGTACKEVMVSAPLVVLLFERTFISGSFRRALQKSWLLYVGLALAWGLLVLLNFTAPRSESAGFHLGLSAASWWLTQTKILWTYLKLAVWPWPLTVHYDMPYLTTVAAAWPWLLATVLLGIAVLVLLWRRNSIGFVGAWTLLILSPTLVVPIITEVAAERRMYLPLAALTALVVVGGYILAQFAAQQWRASSPSRHTGTAPRWPTAIIVAISLTLAVVLSLVSVRRLAAYHDTLTLWQDAVIYQPDDPLIQYNLGNALREVNQLQSAMDRYQLALRLKPNYPEAHNNLGIALAHTGQLQEAIRHYQQALILRPGYVDALNNLGEVYLNAGQSQEAIDYFQQALRLKPYSAELHYNFGNALKQTGRLPEAIAQYEESLRLDPQFSAARGNMGVALAMAGHSQEAIDQFKETLKLQPDNAEAHNNLGFALFSAGNPQDATEQYLQAIRVKPDYTQAWFNLVHAYAQLNRPADALAAAQKALELARRQGQTTVAQQIETWLTKYQADPSKAANVAPSSETNSRSR